jgi:hypothetical protein
MVVGTGDSARRCDATCHDARGPRCSCICGGRYHGAGRAAQAQLVADVVDGKLGPELAKAAKLAELERNRGEGSLPPPQIP